MNTPIYILNRLGTLVSWVTVFTGLYLSSLYNYLLFHSIAELFAVVVACGIFMMGFNSRKIAENPFILFLGIAYLSVGIIDTAHLLGYKGMNVFPGYDANLPTQLWIAARYLESISLLTALVIIRKKFNHSLMMAGYVFIVVCLLVVIFKEAFPDCFVEGVGLTPFKRISEYLICCILVVVLILLHRNSHEFSPILLRLLTASILLTIASELCFTFYLSVYGLSNLIGHYLKICSYYCIYKAFIETGFSKPYNLLFKNLTNSEKKYRDSTEFYENILNTIPSGVWVTGKDDVISYANQSLEKVYGLKADQLKGMHVFRSFPEETVRQFEPYYLVARSLQNPVPYHEILVTTPAGRTSYQSGTLIPRKVDKDYHGIICIVEDVTIRKLANEKLKKSERRLKEAQQVAKVANWEHDFETGEEFWSEELYRLFGYSSKEVLQSKDLFKKHIYTDDYNTVTNEISKSLHSGESFAIDCRYIPENGSIRYANIICHVDLDTDGKPKLMHGTFQDITERKWIELSIQESERQLSTLMSNLPGTAYRCKNNLNRTMLFISDGCLNLTEYQADELIEDRDKSYNDLIHPDDRKSVRDTVRDSLSKRQTFEVEYRLVTANGIVKHVWEKGVGIYGKKGSLLFLEGFINDISERKKMETALVASETRMRAYLNNSPQMIYMKDLHGRYLIFNRACEKVFNLSEREVLGKTNRELYDKETTDQFDLNDEKVIKSQKLQIVDEVIFQEDGPHIYHSTQFPVYDDSGRFIGISGVSVDITKSKEIEEDLQHSQDQLRRLAVRMAEVEESEKKVLSQVLHDQVGQNLTVISINLTILKNLLPSKVSDGIYERLTDSQNLIEEIIGVTRDVVVELRPGILDDYGLMAALRWFGGLFARRTNISVDIHGDDCSTKILPSAVEISLFRITQEALTNIAKHAKANHISVTLERKPDKKIILSIVDDGIGFNPGSPSLGLGLVMMRERVLSTGGHWMIQSDPGVGTKIQIEI